MKLRSSSKTASIAVFQKARICTAKQKLQRLLDLLETSQDPNLSWLLRNAVSISESLGVNARYSRCLSGMEDRTLAGRELRQRVFNTGSQVKLLCNRKASYSGGWKA